jgi:hypothetical protein
MRPSFKKQSSRILKIEKLLLAPRLKVVGAVMMVLSIAAFSYGLATQNSNKALSLQVDMQSAALTPSVEDDPSTPYPEDIFNFYVVSLIFAGLSLFCFAKARKKLS